MHDFLFPKHYPLTNLKRRYVWRMLERSMDLPLGKGSQVGEGCGRGGWEAARQGQPGGQACHSIHMLTECL